MRIGYPTSFLTLLLYGFALAILPLIVAFINANIAFNTLTFRGQTAMTDAVQTTRASHVLQEQLHVMERSTRQYFVLHDQEFLNLYQQSRAVFNEAILAMNRHTDEPKQVLKIDALRAQAQQLHSQIMQTGDFQDAHPAFLDAFRVLSQQATALVQDNDRLIDAASAQLMTESRHAQQRFFMQSLVLIPLALLVTGLMAYMIGRPIQRMDNAIARLGKGEYQTPIRIHGPGNLSVLGQRLDWLRLELLQLKAQKQQFLQHISHELKTPLTAIREAAELLTDGVGGALTQQQQEITLILRDNSLRLQKMIENLLTFTRMEAGKLILNRQNTVISALVQRVLESHALSIRNKQLRIHQDYQLTAIVADSDKLLTILDNLLSNAIKYSPLQGEIKLLTKAEKNWQVIEVIDCGPGLSQEDKRKLFDPFHQGKTVHQGLVSSSGLGLAVSKDLVEAHQGTIALSETSAGAHFVVRLPHVESV